MCPVHSSLERCRAGTGPSQVDRVVAETAVAVPKLTSFFADVPARLVSALPAGVAVTFAVAGAGGGEWTVERTDEGSTRVLTEAVARPDCRLACNVSDFHALLEGELDPREGFLAGRLEVEGDVGLVLALHRCLVT